MFFFWDNAYSQLRSNQAGGRLIESGKAAVALSIMGFLTLIIGFLAWRFPLLSIPFESVGIYWLAAGFALKYAGREVSDSGFIYAMIFGVIGVIYWFQVEHIKWHEQIQADDFSKGFPTKCPNCRWKRDS